MVKLMNKKVMIPIIIGGTILASGAYGISKYRDPVILMNNAIEKKDYKTLVSIYNRKIINSEHADFYNDKIYHILSDMMREYELKESEYKEVLTNLNYFTQIHNTGIMNLTKDHIDYVTIESNGESLLKDASLYLYNKDYINTLVCISKIDKHYSNYEQVDELYNRCISEILVSTNKASNEDEYNSYIALLDQCFDVSNEDILLQQKQNVEKNLMIYIEVNKILENIKSMYANEDYKNVFITFNNSLIKYPESNELKASFVHYKDLYITYITNKCNEYIDNKNYSSALELVNNALECFECQEFNDLIITIKKKQNPFYQITDFFGSLFN